MKLSAINRAAALLCLALACAAARAEHADRNQPVQLEADRVNIDDARQTNTFEGNVLLSQGTLSIRGDKLVVVQDGDGFSHGTATGNLASFSQKRDGLNEYVEGYAERIEYDTKNETVNFYRQARMTKGGDEVRGDHITYSAKTEIFQVHADPGQGSAASGKGRVRVTLQPKGTARTPTAATPSAPEKQP